MIKNYLIYFTVIAFLTITIANAQTKVVGQNTKEHSKTKLFATLAYPLIYRENIICNNKYCDEYYKTAISRSIFNTRTPAMGFGVELKHRKLFINTSASYFYANRKLEHNYTATALSSDAPEGQENIFKVMLLPGQKYYINNDVFNGTIHYHYLNYCLNIGLNSKKNLSYYIALNLNKIIQNNYSGVLKRESTEIEITGITGPYQYITQNNGATTTSYRSDQIPQILDIKKYNDTYLGFGIQGEVEVLSSQIFIGAELLRCISGYYLRKDALNIKIGYYFR